MLNRVAAARNPPTVAAWRLVLVASVAVYCAQRTAVDTWLEQQWAAACKSQFVRHDSFEPIVATISFGVWINMWRVVDLFCPSMHRWRLHGSVAPSKHFKGQNKLEFLLKPGVSYIAALAYLVPLFAFDAIYPRRKLPLESPTSAEVLGGLCAAVFAYDLVFYFVHLALHKSTLLYRWVHAVHHSAVHLQSKDVVNHSFIDGTLQVGTNVVVLNTLGLHPLTRALYNVVLTYLLTESHSGYDMPWMLHNIMPHGLLGGSPAHEAHHHHGAAHYHQFFTYFDTLFGFHAARKLK